MFDQRIEIAFGVSGYNMTFILYKKRVHYYFVSYLCVPSVIKALAKK
jgi:hypothetical protein